MNIDLPLAKMSSTEKLSVMEALWDDLCHTGKNQPPHWHQQVLQKRSQEAGNQINFSDWESAKNRIRKTLR